MKHPNLFEPAHPVPAFIPQTDDNGNEWGDIDSCLAAFGTNACTLDGRPAHIIGTPRTSQYACIEPVDLEADSIRACWDVVQMVMEDGAAFVRSDDDTDD